MSSIKNKCILAIAIATAMTGCASVQSQANTNANYRIKSNSLKAIEADINQKIMESSLRIEKQLELLNEKTNKNDYGEINGRQADYRVRNQHNVKEITHEDVKLMIEEGRSKNNPSKKLDRVIPNGVIPEKISNSEKITNLSNEHKRNLNNFYKHPVQIDEQKINLTPLSLDVIKKDSLSLSSEKSKIKKDKKKTKIEESSNQNIQSPIVKSKESLDRPVKLKGSYQTTELIKKLANGAGYQFVLKGQDKNMKMDIGRGGKHFEGTIKDALINIGNGFGEKALVDISTKNKIITLEYR